jgi:hypothetical protein
VLPHVFTVFRALGAYPRPFPACRLPQHHIRENVVQMTIRCLAGGSFHDVRRIAGVSIPSYYRLVQKGIDAVVKCTHPSLAISFPETESDIETMTSGFRRLSSCGLFEGCIGCIDGWLCRVRAPPQKDTQGPGQRKYFSGHYQAFGINVQCVCDFESRFTYVSAMCPGSVSDLVSYEETELSKRVEKLPVGVFLLGDNAYMLSEHLLTPFPGNELPSNQDAFNFYLSQLRIRVKMAFGLLVSKWRSFRAPIEASIEHTTQRVLAAQKLHNFYITERLQRDKDDHANASEIEPLHFQGTTAAYLPSDLIVRVGANSLLRDIMVRRISDSNAVRPTYNVQRREREDNRTA